MVAISGNVSDLVGAYFEDFVLVAKPTHGFFNSSVLIAQSSISMRALSGTLTGSLPETETSGQLIQFSAHFTADGIYQEIFFTPVVIPNVVSLDISSLLTILIN